MVGGAQTTSHRGVGGDVIQRTNRTHLFCATSKIVVSLVNAAALLLAPSELSNVARGRSERGSTFSCRKAPFPETVSDPRSHMPESFREDGNASGRRRRTGFHPLSIVSTKRNCEPEHKFGKVRLELRSPRQALAAVARRFSKRP